MNLRVDVIVSSLLVDIVDCFKSDTGEKENFLEIGELENIFVVSVDVLDFDAVTLAPLGTSFSVVTGFFTNAEPVRNKLK